MADGEGLHVIIVGAGLAGLATAVAVLRAGHSVTVLEAAQQIGEIGAGIQLSANGVRILQSWGLEDAMTPHVTRPDFTFLRRWDDGRILSTVDMLEYGKRFKAPFWDVHRANFHNCLYEETVRLGGKVYVDKAVVDIDFDAATVKCADGSAYSGDLIVAADGVNSKCRDLFFGRRDPPRETGDLAYRLMIDGDRIRADPEIRDFIEIPRVHYWIGPDRHAVCYMLRGGKALNMVLLVPDNLPPGEKLGKGSIQEMKDHYKGWDPRMVKLLDIVDLDTMVKWKLCIRDELACWQHKNSKFVMLGDAVHATLPYMSQGASSCMESAAVLGTCLSKVTRENKDRMLPLALKAYQKSRIPRTSAIVQGGCTHQHYWHLHDGPEQEKRDALYAMESPPKGIGYLWRCPEFAPYLFGYDPVADAEAAFASVLNESGTDARL